MGKNKKKSKDEKEENKKFFSTLESSMRYYDSLIEGSIKENEIMDQNTNRRILKELHALIQKVIRKNIGFFYENVDFIFYISEKFKEFQFSVKYLDFSKYSDDYWGNNSLERIKERDNILSEEVTNLDAIQEQINTRLELFSEKILPNNFKQIEEEFNKSQLDEYRIRIYLDDYCNRLTKSYEILVPIAVFILILCRFLLNKPYNDLLEDLKNKHKSSVLKFFDNQKKSSNDLPLLKECLERLFPPDAELPKYMNQIFGNKGIRVLRNFLIHNKDEKNKCEIEDNHIIVNFDDGNSNEYTINDILRLHAKMFIVSIQVLLYCRREKLECLYIIGKEIENKREKK